MDFSRKRRILKSLADSGKRHFWLFLPCLIAAAFVKLFYNIAMRLDLLFSDSEGRFLGMQKKAKAAKKAPSAAPNGHTPETRTPSGGAYVTKRPTYARILSSVLAVCLVCTFLPTVGVRVSAAVTINDSNAEAVNVGGATYYVTSQERNQAYVAPTISWDSKGYGNTTILLKVKYNSGSQSDYTGIRLYEQENTGGYKVSTKYNFDPKALGEVLIEGLKTTSSYSYYAEAYITIPKYIKRITPAVPAQYDDAGNQIAAPVAEKIEYVLDGLYELDSPKPTTDYYSATPDARQAAPGNIKATTTVANPNNVSLEWDESQNSDGYIIWRTNRDTGRQDYIKTITGVTNITATDVLPIKSTIYDYTVMAYRGITPDYSTYMNNGADKYYILSDNKAMTYETATVVSQIDTPVAANIPFSVLQNSIFIDWNDNQNIRAAAADSAGYMVYRVAQEDIDAAFDINQIASDNVRNLTLAQLKSLAKQTYPIANTTSELDDDSANIAKQYHYVVTAYRRPFQDNLESNHLIISTEAVTKPAKIENLQVQPEDKMAYVYWDTLPVSEVDRYTLTYWALDANGNRGAQSQKVLRPNEINFAGNIPYTVTGLTNGTTYEFSVVAINDASIYSDPSNSVKTVVGGTPEIPQIKSLTAAQNQIVVTWDPVIADSYLLERGEPNEDGMVSTWTPIEVTGTTYIDEGLTNNKEYRYRVSSVKTIGTGRISGSDLGSIKVTSSPSVAQTGSAGIQVPKPIVNKGLTVSGRNITFSWKAGTLGTNMVKEDGYYVYIRDADGNNLANSPIDTTDLTYSFEVPAEEVEYFFSVVAYANYNRTIIRSPELNLGSKMLPETILTPPLNVTGTLGLDAATITWAKSSNANATTAYELYGYRTSNGKMFDANNKEINADGSYVTGGGAMPPLTVTTLLTYTHTPLPDTAEGDKWTYYIIAKDATGALKPSPKSAEWTTPAISSSKLATPRDVALTSNRDEGTLTITWTASDSASLTDVAYRVYAYSDDIASGRGSISDPILLADTKKLTFTFAAPTDDNKWSYYVESYDAAIPPVYKTSPPSLPVTDAGGNSGGGVEFLLPPRDFTATSALNAANLSWTAVTGATGYVVYAEGPNGTKQQFDITTTTFSHTALRNGDIWSYYVIAYNVENPEKPVYSVKSDTRSVTIGGTNIGTLLPPRDFTVTAGAYSASLSWTAVPGANGYYVNATGPTGNFIFNVTSTTFTHNSLTPGDVWEYKVKAYAVSAQDEYEFSADTYPQSVTIGSLDVSKLLPPRDIAVTTTRNAANLSWTAVAGATGYKVYAFGPNDPNNGPREVNITGTSYTHNNLTYGETWVYYVKAYTTDTHGNLTYSDASDTLSATIGITNFNKLLPPRDFTATADGNAAKLSWSAVTNANGYIVYAKGPNGAEQKFDITTTTFTHSNLTPGSTWEYRVEAYAVDNTGTYTYSDSTSAQTVTVDSPAVTKLLPPRDFTVLTTQNTSALSWTAVAGASGYKVYAIGPSGPNSQTRMFDITTNSYTHNNLTPGDTWEYYVVAYAVDSDGLYIESDESVRVSVKIGSTNVGKLLPPRDFTATSSLNGASLSWTAVAGANGYIVHAKGASGSYDFDITANTFAHNNLTTGSTWEYYVKAYTVDNTGAYTYSDNSITLSVIIGGANIGKLLPPRDFTVTAGNNAADLKWTAVTGANGYVVHAEGPTGTHEFDITTTTFTHGSLRAGDVWKYSVKAYTVDNTATRTYSDSSNTQSVTIGGTVTGTLLPPRDFVATPGDNAANLAWTAVTGAVGYIVTASGPTGTYEFDLTKNSFAHGNLKAGDVWRYSVKAYTVDNTGKYTYSKSSDTQSVTIGGTGSGTGGSTGGTTLPAPLDFKVVTTDGVATLSWSAVTDAYSYTVHASSRSKSQSFDVSTTTFIHDRLLNGEEWTYYVTANALDKSNGSVKAGRSSEPITVTIGVTLAQPQDLIATNGNRQIDLSWSAVEGAEGYIVYLYNNALLEFEPIAVISSPFYSATGLINGTRYSYMVTAYKYINNEQTFSPYSLTAVGVPTTGSPTDLDRIIEVKGALPYGMDYSELVSATANHGAFDEDVDVYISTKDDSTKAVRDLLSGFAGGISSFIVYPFDISVYYADTRVEATPNNGFGVTFALPIPDELVRYRDYINVLHINDFGEMEILPSTLTQSGDNWIIHFTGTSFSPYAFVIYKDQIVDASSGTSATATAGSFNLGNMLTLTAMFTNPVPTVRKYTKRRVYHIKVR